MVSDKRSGKKLVLMILAGLMGISLCACGGMGSTAVSPDNDTVQETEAGNTDKAPDVSKNDETETVDIEKSEIKEETEASENAEEWKELMLDAVDEKLQTCFDNNEDDEFDELAVYIENSSFELLYIDDDDIPEVYVRPASGMMDGTSILYLNGDSIGSYDIGWSDSVSYIEKSGIICLYHGMHVPVQELIMTFPEEKDLGHGAFSEPGWYDGEDHSIEGSDMEYMWNDEFVSEEDYNKNKDDLFKGDIHVAGEEKSLSYEELMNYLGE
ncbi:MAG: hypothetical protein K5886_12830 [Lachnospiraceae bacterium]|nr:hypothetical protein [Lachnospiraceae bacterium]